MSASAYLDKTGLARLWNKVKALVPALSDNIAADRQDTAKAATPKAVADYVDDVIGDIETLLSEL